MSILAMDSFDFYATVDDVHGGGRWVQLNDISFPTLTSGRFGGQALSLSTWPSQITLLKGLEDYQTNLYFGASIQLQTEFTTAFFRFDDLGYGSQVSILITSDGRVHVVSGDVDGTVIAVSDPVIFQNQWTYIEGQFWFETGYFQIQVNGNVVVTGLNVLNPSGRNHADGFIVGFDGNALGNGESFVIDDVYIGNHSDVPPNNSFLGSWMIEVKMPSGDTAQKDFETTVPTSDANYVCLNELPQNGDTSYVQTVNNSQDLYLTPQWEAIPDVINAIQIVSYARKAQAGALYFNHHVLSEWNNIVGRVHVPGTSYRYFTDLLSVDPNTGVQWTGKAVNALKAGFITTHASVPDVTEQTASTIPQPWAIGV